MVECDAVRSVQVVGAGVEEGGVGGDPANPVKLQVAPDRRPLLGEAAMEWSSSDDQTHDARGEKQRRKLLAEPAVEAAEDVQDMSRSSKTVSPLSFFQVVSIALSRSTVTLGCSLISFCHVIQCYFHCICCNHGEFFPLDASRPTPLQSARAIPTKATVLCSIEEIDQRFGSR